MNFVAPASRFDCHQGREMLQLLATVRSGRMDSFKRGPRARAFSCPDVRTAKGEERDVDLETPLRSLLSELGLDLYDLEMVRGP